MSERIDDLNELTEQMLSCRDEGHRWRHVTDEVTTTRTGKTVLAYTQVRRCDCGTERRRTVAVPSFEIVAATYTYPDGYLIAPGTVADKATLHTGVRRVALERLLASEATVRVKQR